MYRSDRTLLDTNDSVEVLAEIEVAQGFGFIKRGLIEGLRSAEWIKRRTALRTSSSSTWWSALGRK